MGIAEVRDECRVAAEAVRLGNPQSALAHAESAVAKAERELTPMHYGLGLSLMTLGLARAAVGREAEAVSAFERATLVARALSESDFEHAAVILRAASRFNEERGRSAAAKSLKEELVALTKAQLGGDHPRYFAELAELSTLRI